jgi:hypothetical protein
MFQITRTNDNLETEILQYFDNYAEAKEYCNKVADQNILAKINVAYQDENPVQA